MENKATFKLKNKSLFFTFARSDFENKEVLDHLAKRFAEYDRKIVKYVVAKEKHEDGGYHTHAYVLLDAEFSKVIPANFFDYKDHHPNFQSVRSNRAVAKYCQKGEDYITNCEDFKLKVTKDELALKLINGEKLNDLVKEYPRLLFGYSRLKADIQGFFCDTQDLKSLDNPCGVWIAGPSGSGKSTIATERMGTYYFKGHNKWWDGYTGQPTVVCEDVDISWKDVWTFFKIWADRYPFLGETKNGTVRIRPTKFVVTSNLTIEELLEQWKWPTEDYAPYTRRFRSYYIRSIDEWEEGL